MILDVSDAVLRPVHATPPNYQIYSAGIVDAEHSNPNGLTGNNLDPTYPMDESGHLLGYAPRYNGTFTDFGATRWFYDPDTSTQYVVNFEDAEHTKSDGTRSSAVRFMNTAGQVIGTSNRYNVAADAGRSAWYFDLPTGTRRNIGLLDNFEHLKLDGFRDNSFDSATFFESLNNAGQATGIAKRYNFSLTDFGESAWFYDRADDITRDIGLVDNAHTRSDGYKESKPLEISSMGYVAGTSKHYYPGATISACSSAVACQSVWLFDPHPVNTITYNIGLTDALHTASTGQKYSAFFDLNTAGQVVGTSNFYPSGGGVGVSAWFYDVGTHVTSEIGLMDAEHTSGSVHSSSPVINSLMHMNEAGQTPGIATRYSSAGAPNGQSAWLFTPSTGQATKIGLVDAEHTTNANFKRSNPLRLNAAGQTVGWSERYMGGSPSLGFSTWLYDPLTATNRHIGLFDAEHTRNDGYKNSDIRRLDDAGHAIGYSYRYNIAGTQIGQSSWTYDAALDVTRQMGLVGTLQSPDTEHLRNDGTRYSDVSTLSNDTVSNQAGRVVGTTRRYNAGSTQLGDSVWLYDFGTDTTRKIGLTDAMHTRNDGYKRSKIGIDGSLIGVPSVINVAGQVIGRSERYNGGANQIGHSGWFYDPTLDQTFPLVFSQNLSGLANTLPFYLGDDGSVLGYYARFSGNTELGNYLFYWSMADGFYDLGTRISGDWSGNGWKSISNLQDKTAAGWLAGVGIRIVPQGSSSLSLPFMVRPQQLVSADYNHNGVVDAADYVVWRKNNGSQQEYDLWRAHFGEIVVSGSSSLVATIPEPTSLPLFTLAGLFCSARRRFSTSTKKTSWNIV